MTRPHYLLAIHEDTNANATLFADGVPVFAVAEERLTRDRFAAGFPHHSVQAALDFAGLTLADLDAIAPANRLHFLPRVAPQLIGGEHDYFGAKHKAWLYLQHLLARQPTLGALTGQISRVLLQRKLPKLLDFVDHHTAHAASAWLTSGWPQCTVLTADNLGDGWSAKVFAAGPNGLQFHYGSTARHSPGQFYGEIAQLLGFHSLLAGKVTGLAAHGDPLPAYALMADLFSLAPDGRSFVSPALWSRDRRAGRYKHLLTHKPADIAAAAQRRLEEVVVAWVQHAVHATGCGNVAVAGGVFANVVVNQKILALPDVQALWVHPAMTDQGISMGAGLWHLHQQGRIAAQPMGSVFLGPTLTDGACRQALQRAQLPALEPPDMAQTAADALVAGKVVARCVGRMEYGPRALGNRSILCRADDPSANQWLNARLKRSEFMPFAPVTLEEHAAARYLGLDGGSDAARYMTLTCPVTPLLRQESPGVVHLDGTARPQVLRASDNPGYHAIVQRYFEMTGVPTLVNTSLNMHSEPIVCSAKDAVAAYQQGQLDCLILGPYWVQRAES